MVKFDVISLVLVTSGLSVSKVSRLLPCIKGEMGSVYIISVAVTDCYRLRSL